MIQRISLPSVTGYVEGPRASMCLHTRIGRVLVGMVTRVVSGSHVSIFGFADSKFTHGFCSC